VTAVLADGYKNNVNPMDVVDEVDVRRGEGQKNPGVSMEHVEGYK
jgi:hypothetical protein